MEEQELRVGGWEKEKGRRTFRRLFNLILILGIAFAFIGPSVINYNPAYVPSESLYLANGMWNGHFDVQYSKQFSGHVKVSSVTYETTLDDTGELRIISMSSFMNLEGVDFQNRVIDVVKEEASNEDLTLTNGVVLDENLNLQAGYSIYQWDGITHTDIDETNLFFDEVIKNEETVIIKAFFWNEKDNVRQTDADLESKLGIGSVSQYQTVLCVAFGINGKTIEQATGLCEDVF